MNHDFRTRLKSKTFWDQLLVVAVSFYCLGLFLPDITAAERTGLVVATLISCANGRWRAALPYLRHPVFILLGALIGWLGLTFIWSANPVITRDSWWSIFKDYFLLVAPMSYLLEDTQRRRWLTTAFGICGAVIVTINGTQYLREFLVDPEGLLNIKTHRGWAHPLVFFVPFAIAKATTASGRHAIFWYGLLAIEAAMILATGARGAWLALIAAVMAFGLARELWRSMAVLMLIGLIISAISFTTLPNHLFRDRIAQGADTSQRTTGTWGPALEMMNERPWLGFGFGKAIFDGEFNSRVPSKEHWTIKKSKGPHSIVFETGFAGGYPGLLLISALFAAAVVCGAKALRFRSSLEHRAFALAAWASFIGFYAVRGMLESPRWGPMIVLLCGIVSFARASEVNASTRPVGASAPLPKGQKDSLQ